MKLKGNNTLEINYNDENFYNLFGHQDNEAEINRLFSIEELTKPINSRLLTCAFLGSIEKNQEQYIPLIFDAINKLKIELEDPDSKMVFNCLVQNGKNDLVNDFIEKLGIINRTFIENRYIRVQKNGKLEYLGSMGNAPDGISFFEKKKWDYLANPLLFSLEKSNTIVAELLLNESKEINPSVINSIFVESCAENNINIALYLIENEKSKKIIMESSIIKLFLNEKTEFFAIKQKSLAALEVRELKDELPTNNIVERKLKM